MRLVFLPADVFAHKGKISEWNIDVIIGRVDELEKGILYGWAFNKVDRSEKLKIEVEYRSGVIAEGEANVFREDLPAAGVGDGNHAFKIKLPPNIVSLEGVGVWARSNDGNREALEIATNDHRRLDDLFEVFSKRYDKALRELTARQERLSSRLDIIGERMIEIEVVLGKGAAEKLEQLESRLDSAELFVVRLDELTRRLTEDLSKVRRKRFLGIF